MALLDKVGPRMCGVIGAGLMSSGIFFTALAPNIYTIYFTYGIVTGASGLRCHYFVKVA